MEDKVDYATHVNSSLKYYINDSRLVLRLIGAINEADKAFSSDDTGSGVSEYVCEFLLPILEKHGLSITCL